jgi:hypothetical protein
VTPKVIIKKLIKLDLCSEISSSTHKPNRTQTNENVKKKKIVPFVRKQKIK